MKRVTFVCLLAVFMPRPGVDAQDGPYRFVKEIADGGEGGWDYLSVDPAAHRLFVSHGTRIVVIDPRQDTIAGEITEPPGVHGLTVASDLGRGFVANGGGKTLRTVDSAPLQNPHKGS